MTIATSIVPALAANEVIDPTLQRAVFFAEWDWNFEMTSVVPRAIALEAKAVY